MKADPFERFKDLEENHCWQYEVRLRNTEQDLSELGKDLAWAESLRTSDFDFDYVDKSDREQCDEVRDFIVRHEFLGCLPNLRRSQLQFLHTMCRCRSQMCV